MNLEEAKERITGLIGHYHEWGSSAGQGSTRLTTSLRDHGRALFDLVYHLDDNNAKAFGMIVGDYRTLYEIIQLARTGETTESMSI